MSKKSAATAIAAGALAALVAVAAPQASFAQADALIGTWKINLAKSTYNPGPAPRASTLTTRADGQGLMSTFDGINAQGMPTHVVFTVAYDGKSHPVTGSAIVDPSSIKRIDAYKREFTNTKGGNVVGNGTIVVSADGKMMTISGTGLNANGQKTNNIVVYDKQ